jgi:LacI family transcriptional regulator
MGTLKPLTGPAAESAYRMPATIYDVARRAGVSIATVSRVLRGSAPVQDGTRQRVEHAVDELGFVPSRLGVSLAERRHAANGVVFPDLSGPYFAEVVLGYEEVTARLGRSVLILSTREQADPEAAVHELTSRVDGLAIIDATVGQDTVRSIVAGGLPVVLLARGAEVEGADAVAAENTASAERLTEHLLGHGHRRLAFLGDPGHSFDVEQRWAGVRAVLDRRGLPPPSRSPASPARRRPGRRPPPCWPRPTAPTRSSAATTSGPWPPCWPPRTWASGSPTTWP